MGISIENPGDYRKLTAREYLEFFGSFYGVSDLAERITYLSEALELEKDPRPIRSLSLGNRQKLQLIRSLLHRPELIIWDEPTANLDPGSQQTVLEFARRHAQETGATVLLATHQLEQIERFATHFGFLRQGKLVFSGNRSETLALVHEERFRFVFAVPLGKGCMEAAIGEAGGLSIRWEEPGRVALLEGKDVKARVPNLVRSLSAGGVEIEEIRRENGSLIEIFHRLMNPERELGR